MTSSFNRREVNSNVNTGRNKNNTTYGNNNYSVRNSRNLNTGVNNNHYNNNLNQGISSYRYARSNSGINTHSSRAMSSPVSHSYSARPGNSGSVVRSSSSHSGSSRSSSGSSGSRSGSSKGKSSGRR